MTTRVVRILNAVRVRGPGNRPDGNSASATGSAIPAATYQVQPPTQATTSAAGGAQPRTTARPAYSVEKTAAVSIRPTSMMSQPTGWLGFRSATTTPISGKAKKINEKRTAEKR